jgi:hypothetical protein
MGKFLERLKSAWAAAADIFPTEAKDKEKAMAKFNIGDVFGEITKWTGVLSGAATEGAPVAVDLINNVSGAVNILAGIGKDLFGKKGPTPEQVAAYEKQRIDRDNIIANS